MLCFSDNQSDNGYNYTTNDSSDYVVVTIDNSEGCYTGNIKKKNYQGADHWSRLNLTHDSARAPPDPWDVNHRNTWPSSSTAQWEVSAPR